MQKRVPNILFAGGGTGGHLFPAIAIADEIRRIRPESQITFVGTRNRIEARVVPRRGYDFAPIWISGFRRRWSIDSILIPLKIVVALVQSFFVMQKVKPDVVVGTGGYVCGPVVFMASIIGIPTLIQEQNSYPGITTRLLSTRADEVHLTFDASKKHLKRAKNLLLSGNPTRSAIGSVTREEGAAHFELNPALPTLLVFGGSLGAHTINDAVSRIMDQLIGMHVQVIWQTGEGDFEEVNATVSGKVALTAAVRVRKFIERMEYAYAACDLAVCRAGATTVAELTRAGTPSILVPYPFAAADHQTENAKTVVDSGAAVMIKDNDLRMELHSTIAMLINDPRRLKRMAENALTLGKPDAAETLARAALALARV